MTRTQKLSLVVGAIVLVIVIAVAAVIVISSITAAQQSYDRSLCVAAGADDC